MESASYSSQQHQTGWERQLGVELLVPSSLKSQPWAWNNGSSTASATHPKCLSAACLMPAPSQRRKSSSLVGRWVSHGASSSFWQTQVPAGQASAAEPSRRRWTRDRTGCPRRCRAQRGRTTPCRRPPRPVGPVPRDGAPPQDRRSGPRRRPSCGPRRSATGRWRQRSATGGGTLPPSLPRGSRFQGDRSSPPSTAAR